jgi:hypothetical protein
VSIAPADVSTTVALLITGKMRTVDLLSGIRPFTAGGQRAFVTVVGMKVVIHRAMEIGWTMKPRSRTKSPTLAGQFLALISRRRHASIGTSRLLARHKCVIGIA